MSTGPLLSGALWTLTAVLLEADADRLAGLVELGIVEIGEHDVVHRRPGRYRRDEAAHQQPGDRRVAVREMIDVGLVGLASSDGRASPSNPGLPLSMAS